jgi:hypothetical protein
MGSQQKNLRALDFIPLFQCVSSSLEGVLIFLIQALENEKRSNQIFVAER